MSKSPKVGPVTCQGGNVLLLSFLLRLVIMLNTVWYWMKTLCVGQCLTNISINLIKIRKKSKNHVAWKPFRKNVEQLPARSTPLHYFLTVTVFAWQIPYLHIVIWVSSCWLLSDTLDTRDTKIPGIWSLRAAEIGRRIWSWNSQWASRPGMYISHSEYLVRSPVRAVLRSYSRQETICFIHGSAWQSVSYK